MADRAIAKELVKPAIEAVVATGAAPWLRVERAYLRWCRRAKPAPCKFGREQAIAIECRCEGCVEALCHFYFDQVAQKFAADLSPHTKGFQR